MCIKDVSAIQVRNQIKVCIKQWSCSVLGVVLDALRFLWARPPGVSGEENQCSVPGAVFVCCSPGCVKDVGGRKGG